MTLSRTWTHPFVFIITHASQPSGNHKQKGYSTFFFFWLNQVKHWKMMSDKVRYIAERTAEMGATLKNQSVFGVENFTASSVKKTQPKRLKFKVFSDLLFRFCT